MTSICQDARGCQDQSLAFWSTDSWQWGVLAGAGLEFMITPNLSLRAEYLALSLTDSTVSASSIVKAKNGIDCVGGIFNGAPATRQCQMSFQLSEQIARIGLNYKFGGLVAPVTK